MTDAARLHLNELDGMRYLGADPNQPADDIERVVMTMLHKRINYERRRMADG